MTNPVRWIAIIASLLVACAAHATTTKPKIRRPRERSAHASYRTVRYARQTTQSAPAHTAKPAAHTTHATHTTHASRSRTHHYTHRRYARRSRYHHRVVLPKGPTPERITQIQTALARGGYYQGDPSGKWDSDTVAAVQKFQSANNIDATGKLDAPTLQKLGLGSDIAGVAAPRPVVPKVSTGAPAGAPSSMPPVTAKPEKPSSSANPAGAAAPMQSAATTSTSAQPASATSTVAAASSANSSGGEGASGASAIAPSTASGPASASKPAAAQH